ncbi:hypothetical protein CYMTET_15894 [Cymbomonas tetramitiformis]|uniref:Uncharacterized protein n=1 Tax=Cymbomonas tetramitiformis TaxID=36881 RepID=A0AAE0GDA5_9CHLO|nr:hypothetical protein CYMTET_15894 [Cymbomonas tetramitiformis]
MCWTHVTTERNRPASFFILAVILAVVEATIYPPIVALPCDARLRNSPQDNLGKGSLSISRGPTTSALNSL